MIAVSEILKHVDHTQLSRAATESDYAALCDEAAAYNVASVCVPPSRVAFCVERLAGRAPVCTVVGFPNGYQTMETKVFETLQSVGFGAAEIDMVIDIGFVKQGDYESVLRELLITREASKGKILKVIIETALLTEAEKITLCGVVSESGADYIKTSTGFAGGGATFEDVALMRKHAAPHLKVKAAGGISSLEDAARFIELGADRLGTSKLINLAKGASAGAGY